jgi:hypothetical protein
MSGRQKGYPSRPDVSSVGMTLRRPFPELHVEKRSPILVSSGTFVVLCPVLTWSKQTV